MYETEEERTAEQEEAAEARERRARAKRLEEKEAEWFSLWKETHSAGDVKTICSLASEQYARSMGSLGDFYVSKLWLHVNNDEVRRVHFACLGLAVSTESVSD